MVCLHVHACVRVVVRVCLFVSLKKLLHCSRCTRKPPLSILLSNSLINWKKHTKGLLRVTGGFLLFVCVCAHMFNRNHTHACTRACIRERRYSLHHGTAFLDMRLQQSVLMIFIHNRHLLLPSCLYLLLLSPRTPLNYKPRTDNILLIHARIQYWDD